MSSKKTHKIFGTLSFRLTLLYTGLFTLSIIAAFWIIYGATAVALKKNIDRDLREDTEEYADIARDEGLAPLQVILLREAQTDGLEHTFFRLFDGRGLELFVTDHSAWGELPDGAELVQRLKTASDPWFADFFLPGNEVRARVIVATIGDNLILQIGESMEEEAEYLALFADIFGPIMLGMVLLAAGCGWLMARHSLRGVEEVTQTALNITGGEYTRRVPHKSRGLEIERLATAFNDMLDRIQALLNGIREVTDNIAHDLRGPLTSLRGTAETTLMNGSGIEEFRNMAGNTVEESDRLLAMINAMLDISEAEAGASKLEMQDLNITQIVRQACDLYQPLAEDKGLSLALLASDDFQIRGDLKKIQRLISNLLDNALKYTPEGGAVKVEISRNGTELEIAVEDTGIGIDEKDLPNIFHRFFRCDQSRTQEGSGLGLSLALAIVKAHGGRLNVSSIPGVGSRFVVTLPFPPANPLGEAELSC